LRAILCAAEIKQRCNYLKEIISCTMNLYIQAYNVPFVLKLLLSILRLWNGSLCDWLYSFTA
jgi:hypothetical protein